MLSGVSLSLLIRCHQIRFKAGTRKGKDKFISQKPGAKFSIFLRNFMGNLLLIIIMSLILVHLKVR